MKKRERTVYQILTKYSRDTGGLVQVSPVLARQIAAQVARREHARKVNSLRVIMDK